MATTADLTLDELAAGQSIGCDYAFKPNPTPAQLKAAGMRFAGRYASGEPSKDITPAEAEGLLAEGIAIILFFEREANRIANVGSAGGAADATEANRIATACKLEGIPIYFACDFPATAANQPAIDAYLQGAGGAIGPHRVGIYGGIGVVSRSLSHGSAVYAAQTLAWSAGQWEPRANIRQYLSFQIAGCDADHDVAMKADYGQFPHVRKPGPVRHVTHAGETVEDIALSRGVTVPSVLAESAAHYTPADERQFGQAHMPAGVPFYTAH